MATPIRIKRSAVAGKKPAANQLQLGELALNTFDGKIFLKQDQGGVGIGTRIVQINSNEVGNTFFVNKNGDDNDTGESQDRAFLTIKKAVGIASRNDAIHVGAGQYLEDNPLVLDDFTTIIGGDIRNCKIEPANPDKDIIQLGQGGTVQDLSFVGVADTGSAVISYRPLVGVSSDRFFDAARLIRQNLNFIANESVGYITSTDYKFSSHTITDAQYSSITGISTATISNHGFNTGDLVQFNNGSITFSCSYNGGGNEAYPRPSDYASNRDLPITKIDANTFKVNILETAPSTFIGIHTFVSATTNGLKRATFNLAVSSDCADDVKDIYKAVCHDITRGGNSKCIGAGKSYFDINGNLDHIVGFGVTTIDVLNYSIGIARSCINNITWNGGYQSTYTQVKDLSIQADGATGSNSDYGSCANVNSAVTVCVGIVTGIIQNGIDGNPATTGFTTNFPGNNGVINSGILTSSSSPSQGVGVIKQGPYIRNCTNFVKNSIGCKIDGFNSDEGDLLNDTGVQGSFNVDAFTQYNQNGIGVSVTNGAYCQLVSIFTICNDIAIYAGSGGQCDLTNSNSSFGTKGLIAEGIGDETSNCSDRYSGEISVTGTALQNVVTVSGLGNNRPYQGQAIYFDKKYFVVSDIKVVNGGSGYVSPPEVTIASPTGPGLAIPVQAIASIEGGSVSEILVFGGGAQFEEVPDVTIAPPTSGVQATAQAEIEPIYYGVLEATKPVSGISTISLIQNLNNEVGIGTTVYFSRQSFQIVSSHSFQYVGSGNEIESAYPSRGGVTISENEVIKLDGGEITYTSTDQSGNFKIGDGVEINQATGTVSGDIYIKSLFTQVTPFILALGD